MPDLFLDHLDSDWDCRSGQVLLISGKTHEPLFALNYPDAFSEFGVTVALGDIDGDGFGDLALGDANYHVLGPGDPGFEGEPIDLDAMSLKEAMMIESTPWCAFTWESGCARVHSGRTRQVIFGVWGLPGSRQGMGLGVAPLPDISGDGYADLVIRGGDGAYVFAGPGPSKK